MSYEIKHPEVHVNLVGEDGNAFAILARVKRALKRADVSQEEVTEFLDDAKSGDYDHLIQTCMRWVSTD